MTIKRLDHVSVVVDDLAAAIAFFTALGMTLQGEASVEGPWVDRVNGLESVQVDIVMMRTPDGYGRLELTRFRNPKLVEIEPAIAPPNSSARWPSTRTSTDSATCEALRASSSRWPRNSSEAFTAFGETGGALGAPSTRSHGSQPSCFLAYLRRGFVRRTKPMGDTSPAPRQLSAEFDRAGLTPKPERRAMFHFGVYLLTLL